MSPWREWARIVAVGALTGLVAFILTWLLSVYIVEPLTCRQLTDAAACVNSTSLAGNIAAILAATLATVALVRLRTAWPIIIAVGSAALLWDLASITTGLWWLEILGWSVLLYALCYGLFAWISRHSQLLWVVIISLLIVLIIRITLVL